MANHQRHKPRHQRTARAKSSDWVYPQVRRGDDERSRANARRRVAAQAADVETWMKGST